MLTPTHIYLFGGTSLGSVKEIERKSVDGNKDDKWEEIRISFG